jgi:hypothetical protein
MRNRRKSRWNWWNTSPLNLMRLELHLELRWWVRECAGRQPVRNLLLALGSQVGELHAGNLVDLADPNDTSLNSNRVLFEVNHLHAKSLPSLGKAGELKGHPVFTQVDQPAPTILGEEDQHHLRKCLPREETPITGLGNGIFHVYEAATRSGRCRPSHFGEPAKHSWKFLLIRFSPAWPSHPEAPLASGRLRQRAQIH